MLITCPECQFARNINADSIPSKAQLATCPRCQNKFRFRILPEEEEYTEEAAQADGVTGDVADESNAAVSHEDQVEEPVSEDVLDDVLHSVEAAEEVAENTDSTASGAPDADSSSEIEEAGVEEQDSSNLIETESPAPVDDARQAESVEEVQATVAEPVEELVKPVEESTLSQPAQEAVSDSADVCESEHEAVQRYVQEKDSSGTEAASAHIVRDADSGKYDIWDTIAAMGEEQECEDDSLTNCGAASAYVIPWEDGRLNSFSRLSGTVGGLLAHPASFWCGINAKSGVLLPLVFFLFSCVLAIVATVGWLRGITANWSQIFEVVQPILAPQGVILSAVTIPDFAVSVLVAIAAGLLIFPFVLGGITHVVARMIGGSASPFGIGFRTVAYSSGAFIWILVPVAGVFLSLLYLFILYVHGVRAGYNLSLLRSVVTVVTVGLLLTAAVLMITAGVSFM